MNAPLLTVLAACAALPVPALAGDVDITKNRDSHIIVWNTLLGFRYGDPVYDGILPAGHRLQLSEGWITDLSVQQDPQLLSLHRTTTGMAEVTGQPGNYTMPNLETAVAALAGPGGRIGIPDLASSFFDIFVTVDLDDFVQSGGHAMPVGQVLQFVNGHCITQPGLNAGLTEFTFSAQTGWVSSSPFTGQLEVIGEMGLSLGGATCYANCDGSTGSPTLTVNDFLCFISRYAAGDPYANCDGSTTPPVLNVNDFVCFQGKFAQGCP